MMVSPELDVSQLQNCNSLVRERFKEKRIVKFHHATQNQIFKNIKPLDYIVIGIVREPRDRVTSWTFHQRYKPPGQGLKEIKKAKSDKEAVRVAFNNESAKEANERQFILMEEGFSTKKIHTQDNPFYVWTCYEWLIENANQEIYTIAKLIKPNVKKSDIARAILLNSFKKKSGRSRGMENRRDEWRRKGIIGDYVNWFDDDMIEESEDIVKRYNEIIKKEEG